MAKRKYAEDDMVDLIDTIDIGSDTINLDDTIDLDEEEEDDSWSGIAEIDTKREVDETVKLLQAVDKSTKQNFADTMDTEFWCAFYFQTREQKEEFLRKLELLELGDKYIDGMEAARVMGISLTSRMPKMPTIRKSKRLINMT